MAARVKLKRKSYFVDERALKRAKKALGVKTEAEVIRLSVERVAEMEEFWEFMKKSRRSLKPGSVRNPEVDCTHRTTPWSPQVVRISSCYDRTCESRSPG
jgi:hypothetical protein